MPRANPYVESFHSRVRDELLDVEEFSCLAEARVVIGDWQEDYNYRRPHSSLGMCPPAVFAADWTAREPAPIAASPSLYGLRLLDEVAAPGLGLSEQAATFPALHPPPSHSWWTEKRGPARLLATVPVSVWTPGAFDTRRLDRLAWRAAFIRWRSSGDVRRAVHSLRPGLHR